MEQTEWQQKHTLQDREKYAKQDAELMDQVEQYPVNHTFW